MSEIDSQLVDAIEEGNLEQVKEAIEKGANINARHSIR